MPRPWPLGPLRASLRDRFANLDPAPTRQDLRARREDGAEQEPGRSFPAAPTSSFVGVVAAR
jgi:hypothetical protein